MTHPSPLRIGIAGLGRLGHRHAENLARRVPQAQLVAACSPIEQELAWAKTSLGVTRLYKDYAALLAERDLDAVSSCVLRVANPPTNFPPPRWRWWEG